MLALWELLEQHRTALEAQIAEQVRQSSDAQLLLTLPSAGPFMALGLAMDATAVAAARVARSLNGGGRGGHGLPLWGSAVA